MADDKKQPWYQSPNFQMALRYICTAAVGFMFNRTGNALFNDPNVVNALTVAGTSAAAAATTWWIARSNTFKAKSLSLAQDSRVNMVVLNDKTLADKIPASNVVSQSEISPTGK